MQLLVDRPCKLAVLIHEREEHLVTRVSTWGGYIRWLECLQRLRQFNQSVAYFPFRNNTGHLTDFRIFLSIKFELRFQLKNFRQMLTRIVCYSTTVLTLTEQKRKHIFLTIKVSNRIALDSNLLHSAMVSFVNATNYPLQVNRTFLDVSHIEVLNCHSVVCFQFTALKIMDP